MNQVLEAIVKAVLVTLITTAASIAVEKIRRYNEDRYEQEWNQPGFDEYDRW